MVEWQPQSDIVTVLDSVSSITTILAPPDPLVSAAFLDYLISLLHPTAPSSAATRRLITYIYVTPSHQILSWSGTPSTIWCVVCVLYFRVICFLLYVPCSIFVFFSCCRDSLILTCYIFRAICPVLYKRVVFCVIFFVLYFPCCINVFYVCCVLVFYFPCCTKLPLFNFSFPLVWNHIWFIRPFWFSGSVQSYWSID